MLLQHQFIRWALFGVSLSAVVNAQSSSAPPTNCTDQNPNLPDGTYVGDSNPDVNLTSYRLLVTVSGQRITTADFRFLFDGFDWGPGAAGYVEQNDIDPTRRAVFLANEAQYSANALAAVQYNTKLVGLNTPCDLPALLPSSNLSQVQTGLIDAWNVLVDLQLQVVQHVNTTVLGDNNGTLHSWNEYIPQCARDNATRNVPLVLSLHGSGNTIVMAEGLLFPFIGADPANCFITLIPDDSAQIQGDANWNVAPEANSTMLSDVDFLLALIAYEQRTKSIDSTRIYLTGISNGAAMSTYLSMLFPEMFAGIAAIAGAVGCSGGSYNQPFVDAATAVLAKGVPLLPVVAGAGTVDVVNALTPLRAGQGNYTVVKPCYENQMTWWKNYNGIQQTEWDPNYFFGQELNDTYSYTAYSYDIEVGTLAPPPSTGADRPLLEFYVVEGMFHDDPNPSIGALSWDFLRSFSRLADGTLQCNHLPVA